MRGYVTIMPINLMSYIKQATSLKDTLPSSLRKKYMNRPKFYLDVENIWYRNLHIQMVSLINTKWIFKKKILKMKECFLSHCMRHPGTKKQRHYKKGKSQVRILHKHRYKYINETLANWIHQNREWIIH
jgi:hypothetical protein